MTKLTLIAALLIAAPQVLWLVGASPAVVLVAHVALLFLTIRTFQVARRLEEHTRGLVWMGALAGVIGTMASEILINLNLAPSMATAFSAYASVGPLLYRWDVLTWWGPFAFVALGGIFYLALAALAGGLPGDIRASTDRYPVRYSSDV
jgi:hypothetical protein